MSLKLVPFESLGAVSYSGMPVHSGDFFQNMRTCQAWSMRKKICGKYAKYAAELTLKRLLCETVA